ncbi:hypothetical protein CTI14_56090, partial [Methylobacterium radiotolerans]
MQALTDLRDMPRTSPHRRTPRTPQPRRARRAEGVCRVRQRRGAQGQPHHHHPAHRQGLRPGRDRAG